MTALPLPTEAECQTAIIEAEVIFSPRIHRPFTLMEILTDFICADQGQVSE